MTQENIGTVRSSLPGRILLHLVWIGGVLLLCVLFLVRRESGVPYSATQMRSFGEALRLSMPAQPLPAPTFRLSDLTGQVFTLEELQGKIVFLNFWATWCPPCRAEMPGMEKLFQRMQGKDFVMLAINFQEGPEQVQEFIAQFQLHLPALLDTDGTVGTAYKVTGLPTTFILDRRGRIIASVIGPREWDSEASYAFFDHLLLHQ